MKRAHKPHVGSDPSTKKADDAEAVATSSEFFFSVGTIGESTRKGRKPSSLLSAMRHNRRQIPPQNCWRSSLVPERSTLNETLMGLDTPEAVVALLNGLLIAAGVEKRRKDHVQAVELVFSLPAGTTVDSGAYFRQCLNWVVEKFGEVILSADIHRDEAHPHCHILIHPLVEGRMCGSSLVTRPRLAALWESFAREVARPFGLNAPPRRMSPATRVKTASEVLGHLAIEHPLALQIPIWPVVRQAIERDPTPYAAALGVSVCPVIGDGQSRKRTMVEIFTSAGKGGRIECDPKHIGFAATPRATEESYALTSSRTAIEAGLDGFGVLGHDQNLSCVGFAFQRTSDAATHEACEMRMPKLDQPESAIEIDETAQPAQGAIA